MNDWTVAQPFEVPATTAVKYLVACHATASVQQSTGCEAARSTRRTVPSRDTNSAASRTRQMNSEFGLRRGALSGRPRRGHLFAYDSPRLRVSNSRFTTTARRRPSRRDDSTKNK
ncbi:hypothetical protein EVAR_33049_1 [Eumeta japonica]|uniref:Uncharacterized protein n=1 Tax=Eumeta variegata TaxID=151549 RepID=A0A4C1WUN1_EUMVA|nr:hypothetical protein EVAR_33049_1 [Eumeta japonica]